MLPVPVRIDLKFSYLTNGLSPKHMWEFLSFHVLARSRPIFCFSFKCSLCSNKYQSGRFFCFYFSYILISCDLLLCVLLILRCVAHWATCLYRTCYKNEAPIEVKRCWLQQIRKYGSKSPDSFCINWPNTQILNGPSEKNIKT